MLEYFVLDVDGTLTDGGIYYDSNGNELKKFCVKDGPAFAAAHEAGIKLIILTGRECEATTRRMKELNVDFLFQNVKNKALFLRTWMSDNEFSKEAVGYIGDDINDIETMKLCSYVGCPGDACEEVKKIAHYVSPVFGGHGAVRDVIEHYLKEQGVWDKVTEQVFHVQ